MKRTQLLIRSAGSSDEHDWDAGRGELNISLKTIRAQESGLTDYALADEIHRRAVLYREVMGEGVLLTPTALAKHWIRVHEESSRPRKVETTNSHAPATKCETVLGRQVRGGCACAVRFEEYAPCPDCHPTVDASFWRYDGTRAAPPDPARVREMMRREDA